MSATLDANILLYASDRASPVHERALDEVERRATGPEALYLFWPVTVAYLRIATHPAIFESPLTFSDAARNVGRLLDRRHVYSPGEGEGFWRLLDETASEARASGNVVPDAHLVTLMRQYGVRTIVTRDRDFRRFDGIRAHDPFE